MQAVLDGLLPRSQSFAAAPAGPQASAVTGCFTAEMAERVRACEIAEHVIGRLTSPLRREQNDRI
jgi:hypothetical protein